MRTVVFSSLYVSGATVNAIERHTLPNLEDIDRIEIQKEPMSPKADLMASSLADSQDVANLVKIVDRNRSSWKNAPLRVTPRSTSSACARPGSFSFSYLLEKRAENSEIKCKQENSDDTGGIANNLSRNF